MTTIPAEIKSQLGRIRWRDTDLTCTADEVDDKGEIGHGTFGSVRSIVHKATGAKMAVKLLRDSMKPDERKKLLTEIKMIQDAIECSTIVVSVPFLLSLYMLPAFPAATLTECVVPFHILSR